MFFDNAEAGFQLFKRELSEFADLFAKQQKCRVVLKPSLLVDCYENAAGSLTFHGIDVSKVNHFKELAHLVYWVAKLKPFRVAPPGENIALFKELSQVIFGASANVEDKTKEYLSTEEFSEAQKEAIRLGAFPLNEWLAISFLIHIVDMTWCAQLEEVKDPGVKKLFYDRIEFLRSRFYARSGIVMASSLRYHTFSARGLAIAFEAMLDVNTDITSEFT